MVFFSVDRFFWLTDEGTRADSSPLPELYEGLEPWDHQEPLVPSSLLRSPGNSESLLVLSSPIFGL